VSSSLGRVRRPWFWFPAAAVVALAAVVSGVVGWAGLTARADALEQSRAETQYRARLQTARTELVAVDIAAARDVWLTGSGRGRPSARDFQREVGQSMAPVTSAASEPDREKLATASRAASAYAAQIERARTLAAAGDPFLSTNVMRQAGGSLRADVLAPLKELQDISAQRLGADERPVGRNLFNALGLVILTLALCVGVHGWRALRTVRALSVASAGAAGVTLVFMLVAPGSVIGGVRASRDVREGPLVAASRLGDSRIAAFDARSLEALSVLDIAYNMVVAQPHWQAAVNRAAVSLPSSPDLGRSLKAYERAHERLVTAYSSGTEFGYALNDLAIDRADGPTGAFAELDAVTGAELARQVHEADDGWRQALAHLRLIAWVTLAAGVLAAVLVLAALEQRRREYR
jgi:hypothetical protein